LSSLSSGSSEVRGIRLAFRPRDARRTVLYRQTRPDGKVEVRKRPKTLGMLCLRGKTDYYSPLRLGRGVP
jgi:hypothetical protein